jgi:hypothetical protein
LQRRIKLRIRLILAFEPQFQRRRIQAFQALSANGFAEGLQVFATAEQFFAQFDAGHTSFHQQRNEAGLAALAYEVGTEGAQADGNGESIHCYCPLKPVSFLFETTASKKVLQIVRSEDLR